MPLSVHKYSGVPNMVHRSILAIVHVYFEVQREHKYCSIWFSSSPLQISETGIKRYDPARSPPVNMYGMAHFYSKQQVRLSIYLFPSTNFRFCLFWSVEVEYQILAHTNIAFSNFLAHRPGYHRCSPSRCTTWLISTLRVVWFSTLTTKVRLNIYLFPSMKNRVYLTWPTEVQLKFLT